MMYHPVWRVVKYYTRYDEYTKNKKYVVLYIWRPCSKCVRISQFLRKLHTKTLTKIKKMYKRTNVPFSELNRPNFIILIWHHDKEERFLTEKKNYENKSNHLKVIRTHRHFGNTNLFTLKKWKNINI